MEKSLIMFVEAIFHTQIIHVEWAASLSPPFPFIKASHVPLWNELWSHVSHFTRRKDSRISRGWMGLTYWKGTILFFAEQRKRTLDLCRLNETTSVALSFANDVTRFRRFRFSFSTFARDSFSGETLRFINIYRFVEIFYKFRIISPFNIYIVYTYKIRRILLDCNIVVFFNLN